MYMAASPQSFVVMELYGFVFTLGFECPGFNSPKPYNVSIYIHIYRIYTYLTNDVKGKVGISSSWLSWLGPSWLMLAVSSGKLVDPVEPVEPGMTWSCPWAK